MISRSFFKGDYREVLRLTIDRNDVTLDLQEIEWIIGALAFTGRVAEAEVRFHTNIDRLTRSQRIACRFFLAITFMRQSRYAESRQLFATTMRDLRASVPAGGHDEFFAFQGLAFYHYFCGRFDRALKASNRAFTAAIAADFLYGRALAGDIRAHILVQCGQIEEGFGTFEETQTLAKRLGSGAILDALEVSVLIYRAQFGISPVADLKKLKKKTSEADLQDTYSRSNLLLELSRQYVLRGKLAAAAASLRDAAKVIYRTQNRRHEVVLNLRQANIQYLRGDFQNALSLLNSAKKSLDPAVDEALSVQVSGSEERILQALGWDAEARAAHTVVEKLTSRFSGGVNLRIWERNQKLPLSARIGKDPLGDLLDQAQVALTFRNSGLIDEFLVRGYLQPLVQKLGFQPGSLALILDIRPGEILSLDRGEIGHFRGLTPTMRRIASVLARGPTTKKTLIETVWGYRYHPLQHDPVLYSAITAFRKTLGNQSHWLETTEDGYRFQSGLEVSAIGKSTLVESVPLAPIQASPGRSLELNFRQLKALKELKELKQREYWDLKDYRRAFRISAITASRDLSGMHQAGLVVRVGRARATRYIAGESL